MRHQKEVVVYFGDELHQEADVVVAVLLRWCSGEVFEVKAVVHQQQEVVRDHWQDIGGAEKKKRCHQQLDHQVVVVRWWWCGAAAAVQLLGAEQEDDDDATVDLVVVVVFETDQEVVLVVDDHDRRSSLRSCFCSSLSCCAGASERNVAVCFPSVASLTRFRASVASLCLTSESVARFAV